MAKQYKCSNYGVCPEADKDTIFVETDLEEVDGKYVCPHCHQELEELKGKGGGGGKGKLIGIIAAAVVVLGGGSALLFGGKDKSKEPVKEEPVIETPAPAVEPESVPEVEPVPETKPEVKEKPAAPKQSGYNLGWGRYEGPMSGGVPHGLDGEVTVTRNYTLDLKKGGATRELKPGDKITGCKFKEGKLVSGYIHYSNGSAEKVTIGA